MSPRRFCNAFMVWARLRLDEPGWARFHAAITEPPADAPATLAPVPDAEAEQEGAAFMAFYGAQQGLRTQTGGR